MTPAPAELSQFSNGEISVQILKSVRQKDVFVVQSGSPRINDTVMELLIMISACKGGSATKITAVLPYLPYSRQSKKKSHRGAITARLLASLLDVAGVNHIISIDLHATQMQGFFKCPIDNLHAEPLLARWIRQNVADWKDGVVVSKNAGGTKRVTSLADALKLSFGIITTDKRRGNGMGVSMASSMIMGNVADPGSQPHTSPPPRHGYNHGPVMPNRTGTGEPAELRNELTPTQTRRSDGPISPADAAIPPAVPDELARRHSAAGRNSSPVDDGASQYDDHLVQDVTHGRLIQGRIVDDDFPSPSISANTSVPEDDPLTLSRVSSFFAADRGSIGGSDDAGAISDEEEVLQDPRVEHMITLVGDVRNRPVFIVDDMIDKPQSWIAAAETVVKRGHAKRVYCMATHGVFGADCLQQLQECDCIHTIVVTNSIPIGEEVRHASKLVILDLSSLLSEAIRRNHYGESISPLFQHVNG